MTEEEKESAAKRLWHNITDTVYGMAAHDMSRAALRTRASMGSGVSPAARWRGSRVGDSGVLGR